jgi:hypothetical protein
VHCFRRIITSAALVIVGSLAIGCGSSTPRDTARAKPAAATATPRLTIAQLHESARKPVATVGDTTITFGILQHWVSASTHRQTEIPDPPAYTAERLKSTCQQRYDELLKPALSSLIHARWLIGEAADEGLKVDRAKLRRESSPSGPRGEAVRQALATIDETTSDVMLKLEVGQISDRIYRKLERKIPTVTSPQISGYYQRHKDHFIAAEQRDLHVLRAESDAAASKAKREIEHGASFATIVSKTSLRQPDTSHEGLLLGLLPYNWPEPPLSREVFHARLKTLVGPVKSSLGYYLFEVIRRVPARQRTLAEVKPEVAEQLHSLRRDRILSHFIAAFRKKWASKTNCFPDYVVENCRQYKSPRAGTQQSPNAL